MNSLLKTVIVLAVAGAVIRCSDSLGPIAELPRELSIAEGKLVEADNRFAFKLFQEIHQQEGLRNLFVSPLSVAMALGMTYNGAAGTTQQAMQQTLELQGMTIEEVNEAYESLIDLLRNLDPSVDFLLANSIWYRQGITPRQEFLDLNRRYFDAEVTGLDFGNAGAAQIINDWVRNSTAGKIEEIVKPPIPGNVLMYLINAVYFKGDWTHQFDKDRTQDSPFMLADGGQVSVPMMSHGEEIPVFHFADAAVELVDLAYGGGAYRMTVAIPREASGIGDLVGDLSQERWNAWTGQLDSTQLLVSLPRFSLEYELTLNDVLRALGMEVAFTPGADFSRMYEGGGVWIDEVKHKTFVEVNEEGTEAAAVTSVVMTDSAPLMVMINRPFLFAIRERYSGTVLFMGLVMDPTAG